MQTISAKTRLVAILLSGAASMLFMGSSASAQQSIEDNIRPVGQVCLAGESCVGLAVGNNGSSGETATAPAAAASQAATAEPVVAVPAAAVATANEEVAAFDVEAKYQMSCFACHGSGAAGAPMLGDAEAWAARMEKGMDTVMVNVISGVNAMPPKGMCMDCSDENLRSLVDYMVSQ